jgi:hypothetical protein
VRRWRRPPAAAPSSSVPSLASSVRAARRAMPRVHHRQLAASSSAPL